MKSFASIARASVTALAYSSVALLTASSARADILPSGDPTVTINSPTSVYWTYNVFVSKAQNVVTGDYFRIYDFAGFTGFTIAPAGWSATAQATDLPVMTSTGIVNPTDDGGLPNVTFTYTGPTIVGLPTDLGPFTLESQFDGGGVIVAFAGRGTTQKNGKKNGNLTNVLAPDSGGRPGDVPEPGAYAFAVLAAGSVLGLMARKRKA